MSNRLVGLNACKMIVQIQLFQSQMVKYIIFKLYKKGCNSRLRIFMLTFHTTKAVQVFVIYTDHILFPNFLKF